jgi:hypothetical protein
LDIHYAVADVVGIVVGIVVDIQNTHDDDYYNHFEDDDDYDDDGTMGEIVGVVRQELDCSHDVF